MKGKEKVSNVDVYIGSRLKLRRSQLGVSQKRLGKFEKLTFQQIQKYESGVNKIASSRLYRFSRILLVPISYFYDGIEDVIEADEGDKKAIAKVKASMMDSSMHSDLRKLNGFFLKINQPWLRKAVVALAKSLAGGKSE